MNRFSPPLEVVAAQDHRTNVAGSVHKPSRIRFRYMQYGKWCMAAQDHRTNVAGSVHKPSRIRFRYVQLLVTHTHSVH